MSDLYYNLLKDKTVLAIEGSDTKAFLQNLVSNDIYKVNESNSIYTCLLTPQGKFFCDFFIMQFNNTMLLECSLTRKEEIKQKLNLYKLRSTIDIKDLTDQYHVFAVRGNDLIAELGLIDIPGYSKNFMNGYVYLDPRTILMGGRAILPPSTAIQLYKDWGFKANAEDYDYLRIKTIVPEGDKDLIPAKSFPLEYNLDSLNAIDFSKGCYVGQELISRTKYRGTVRKKIMQVTSNTILPSAGSEIRIGDNKIGILRSTYKKIGLALIRVEDYQLYNNTDQEIIAIDQDNNASIVSIKGS